MRRSILEWLSLLAVGLCVSLVGVLAASFRSYWPAEPLQFASDVWVGDDAYLQVRGGIATLFNQLDTDSDSAQPWIVEPRSINSWRVIGRHEFAVWGLAFQYYRFTTGRPVWSVRFSLAIPAALSLIAAVILIRRLRRGRKQGISSAPSPQDPVLPRSGL